MYYVEVKRDGEWHLIGQYHTRQQAALIADDYRAHGETARVVRDR